MRRIIRFPQGRRQAEIAAENRRLLLMARAAKGELDDSTTHRQVRLLSHLPISQTPQEPLQMRRESLQTISAPLNAVDGV